MNTLLVYMVNPQHIEQVNAFLLANNGRELSPDTGWWRIETEMSFKHAFLQMWYWVGDGGFLRISRARRPETILRFSILQTIGVIQI